MATRIDGRQLQLDPTFLPAFAANGNEPPLLLLNAGIRVVCLRTGIVLAKAGGALPKMVTPFKLGVGGRIGSGTQYMSWIDLEDEVQVILHCIQKESLQGPVNSVGTFAGNERGVHENSGPGAFPAQLCFRCRPSWLASFLEKWLTGYCFPASASSPQSFSQADTRFATRISKIRCGDSALERSAIPCDPSSAEGP